MIDWDTQLLLQAPNAMGLVATFIIGRKHRWGWLVSFASEIAWATWGLVSHNPGIFPWCAAWGTIQLYNYHKWRKPEWLNQE